MIRFATAALTLFAIYQSGGHAAQGAELLPESLVGHLPNAIRVDERVISGGTPDGAAGFAELRRLGVRTVVSVDGAQPDVATARRFGLRYVHLPHGYDGIPERRAVELAKAVDSLAGPIYVHCHHGRHRSPAAAAVACVGAGLMAPDEAPRLLELAGTSDHYVGLHQAARDARVFDPAQLKRLAVEFRESVEPPPMAGAMVGLERTHDRLKAIADAGWRTPAAHPDLDPPHEALLLREHFAELLRMEETRKRPADFVRLLKESLDAAERLEGSLREPTAGERRPAVLLRTINAACVDCHRQFRDAPAEGRR